MPEKKEFSNFASCCHEHPKVIFKWNPSSGWSCPVCKAKGKEFDYCKRLHTSEITDTLEKGWCLL